jgi:glucan phosphoethanolaminetransferase (alkaline phosphatase superfamily)
MRAVCLFIVFLLAKALILAGRDLPLSPWMPVAFLWQDVLCVLVFAAIDWALRRPRVAWCVYGVMVLYVAINVPIACTLSTPLTWPILRAARGTLADSIAYHVTLANILRVLCVLLVGTALPMIIGRFERRWPARWLATAAVIGLVLATAGPFASAHVATGGLHRNVFAALIATALPRVAALDREGDWRASPLGNLSSEDLTRFRSRASGRNVVMIHLESAGARYLKPYGASEDPMPNLTQLSEKALIFENAYSAYPETIKSFFSAHCATFPALDTEPQMYARVRTPALAELLAEAGYRSGLFHSGRFGYLGMDAVICDRGFDTLEDAGDIGGDHESSFGIDEESTVRRMLAWIDEVPRGQPFFVTYLPIAGHHPYATPHSGPFPMADEIDRYRNALHYADEALNQLLRGLQARSHYENTLFIIFGDHGEAFGQHEGNYGHTQFIYEENVRVPYLIVAPGLIDEPIRVQRVASLADTAPTVLDLLGLPARSAYQGHSLLEARSQMALFCTDYSLAFVGLRDGRWKAIHELDSGQTKFFDLEEDPEERFDVSAGNPERTQAYVEHLLVWCAAQKGRIARGR